MDREVKAEWVRRLRSGDYVQGRGFLRSKGYDGIPDRYCCLGVLCEIAVEAGVIDSPEATAGSHMYKYGEVGDGEVSGLPRSVREWAGISEDSGRLVETPGSGIYPDLAAMNDSGLPFEQIAEAIEREF